MTWFQEQCDGEWENQYGISIQSCDNPGWWVKILPRLRLHKPDSHPDLLVAQRGDTLVFLGLKESLLETYQISWTSGFTKQSYRLKQNLCSGKKYVELNFLGNESVAGATVWLDGKRVAQLDEDGDFRRDVPLGVHQLRVEKSGVGTWTTELRYNESSSGYDRLPIEVLAKEE